ncbi:MAG: RNA methyltransferase [Acutalibacteraceae bacterium]|nr:RNA methyltransferase [Acutalibacteraceae bacterium]
MNLIEITDFSAPELDVYARLTEAQLLNHHMLRSGMFIAESPKVIARALEDGYEPISFLCEKANMTGETLEVIEKCGDIPVYTAEFDVLTNLTGYMLTRGMLCAMKRKPLPTPQELLSKFTRVVVLEDVMNPTNLGAIFRSAAALGMEAVLLTPGCSNPLYRRSARVSMGTVFQVPWAHLEENWVELLKKYGFKTAAMALTDNSISIDDPHLMAEERLAIVLGTEGDGLKENTVVSCDYTVKIPMSHGVDSLNVAAAGAVAFWQLGKR